MLRLMADGSHRHAGGSSAVSPTRKPASSAAQAISSPPIRPSNQRADVDVQAVMRYNSVPIFQQRAETTYPEDPDLVTEQYSLGGWLEYGGFFVVFTDAYEGSQKAVASASLG